MGRRGNMSSGVWTLWGLAVLGVLASGLAIVGARSDAREEDRQSVSLAAERVSDVLLDAVSSLRGADVLASDGRVDREEFISFAADIVPGSEFTALAFAEPVSEKDRGDWENAAEASIVDSDGRGGFVASPGRPDHVVVRFVGPETEVSLRVIGLDFEGDPLRARGVAEAQVAGGAVIVGPSRLATGGGPGLFIIEAVRDRDDSVVGYVAGGVAAEAVLSSGSDVEGIAGLGLLMDGELLIGERSATGIDFELGGRSFRVTGSDAAGPNWLLSVIIVSGSVLVCAAAWSTGRRQRREREHQRWISSRNARLARLAEQLGTALTSSDVVAVSLAAAGGVLGADGTSLARRQLDDERRLIVAHDGLRSAAAPDAEVVSLDQHLPVTDCVELAHAIVVPNAGAFGKEYPQVAADVEASGIQATLCTPLALGSQEPGGALAFTFGSAIAADRIDEFRATAETLAQMVGRSYERARVRELVQAGIETLGELSGRLAIARSRDEITAAVADLVPALLGVTAASIVPLSAHEGDPCVQAHPLPSAHDVELELVSNDESVRQLRFAPLTRSIVSLIDGAWSRAELYDHGRSVLRRLQDSLLSEPPSVDGLDIAVAYRSAIEAVGIGGDWYSVIDHGDIVYAVIGDVAGHGPGAVALMAEVKTILRYVLSSGASIDYATERASATLTRRNAFASAVVVSIDTQQGRLAYLNAGHPPPLVFDSTGVEALDVIHRPWLGVAGTAEPATVVDFPVGSTVLLYTDGLIEQRNELFDVSLDRLRSQVFRPDEDASTLTQRLIDQPSTRTTQSIDDDVAIIAIRRL